MTTIFTHQPKFLRLYTVSSPIFVFSLTSIANPGIGLHDYYELRNELQVLVWKTQSRLSHFRLSATCKFLVAKTERFHKEQLKLMDVAIKDCKIIEGQRCTKGLNNKQITPLLKFSCQRPKEEEKEILQVLLLFDFSLILALVQKLTSYFNCFLYFGSLPSSSIDLFSAICWNQWFPEAARAMVLQGAKLLFYPTAIGSEPKAEGLDSRDHWKHVMQGHGVLAWPKDSIKLIGKRLKHNMVPEKIVRHIVQELLGLDDRRCPDEENGEAIC
ncbi:hypothetical protein L1887_39019 [Cichorium endivia]|nr:hypothetical protein L1887_39019 [Cichorium endivia]